MKSQLSLVSCVLAMAAASLHGQTVPPPASVVTTGMIGMAASQTARLNLLNPGVQAPAVGVLCAASVAFEGDDGGVLKTAAVVVAPGKSVGTDLFSDIDLKLIAGERKEIRAVITIPAVVPPPGSSAPASTCTLVPTLEIFNTVTGQTMVALGHAAEVPAN